MVGGGGSLDFAYGESSTALGGETGDAIITPTFSGSPIHIEKPDGIPFWQMATVVGIGFFLWLKMRKK